MKKLIAILAAVLLTVSVFAQPPKKMSYQAVMRNSSGELVANQAVGMQISILQGSESGTAVYVETQTATTNANGLVSVEIGGGTGFDTIKWAKGPYFIKTETDPAGGTNYTIMGASQLLSVPYALHSQTAENVTAAGKGLEAAGTQIGQIQYWDGTAWVTLAPTYEEATLTIKNGVPYWAGGIVPSITNPTTGKIWMDRNLGASRAATSFTDAEAFGFLYQWGRGNDGHQLRTSDTTSELSTTETPVHGKFIKTPATVQGTLNDWLVTSNDNLWQGVAGTNNPCPAGFRIPTSAEFAAEMASWTAQNGLAGFASIKLVAPGWKQNNEGWVKSAGTGRYWTSESGTAINTFVTMNSAVAFPISGLSRANAMSVRCIKD